MIIQVGLILSFGTVDNWCLFVVYICFSSLRGIGNYVIHVKLPYGHPLDVNKRISWHLKMRFLLF